LEIYFRYISQNLNTSVSYTFNQSLNKAGVNIPEISKHSGNASLTYSLSEHFKINLRANYIGERENPKIITTTNSKFTDPYLIFFGSFSFVNYKGITAQLTVNNIFDKEYYHTSNRDPDRYRQSQRTIMLSIGYALNN